MDHSRNWETGYEHLVAYYKANGNSNVPRNYVSDDGYRLGNWTMYQRQIQNGRKRRERLTEEQVAALNELDFQWGSYVTSNDRWEIGYQHLLEYQMEYDSVDIKKGYVCDDGYPLGVWLCTQRQRKRGAGKPLTEEQFRRLDELHIKWENLHELNWEDGLSHLKDYFKEHGHTNIKLSYRSKDNYPLGNWFFTQKGLHKKGTLGKDRTRAMEKFNVKW